MTRPYSLFIRLPGCATIAGNRNDRRTAAGLLRAVQSQRNRRQHVFIEASSTLPTWRLPDIILMTREPGLLPHRVQWSSTVPRTEGQPLPFRIHLAIADVALNPRLQRCCGSTADHVVSKKPDEAAWIA